MSLVIGFRSVQSVTRRVKDEEDEDWEERVAQHRHALPVALGLVRPVRILNSDAAGGGFL